MRHIPAIFVLALLFVSPDARSAETAQNPAIDKAQAEVARIQALVEAGAMSRSALDKAESALADAKDELVLSQTLYGKASVDDLTNDQAKEMVMAAQREVDRQQAKVDQAKQFVDQGVMARNELTPLLEELDRRHRTLDLANSRVRLLEELAKAAEREAEAETQAESATSRTTEGYKVSERYDGKGTFSHAEFLKTNAAFAAKFGQRLPVSADGMSATHRVLGFDHRGRVDVALTPDEPEGVWLREYLEAHQIPYFAFRAAVPGKATGAHIHMGPPSVRTAQYLRVHVATKSSVQSARVVRVRATRRDQLARTASRQVAD